ncbi:hypothetical protein F5Y17DRAFT_414279 [Xylariaceae sp. FL0594]|nr:hypothetical protein F5Y17DRAFT_414279 [Xylariaceae sp. FL0594]
MQLPSVRRCSARSYSVVGVFTVYLPATRPSPASPPSNCRPPAMDISVMCQKKSENGESPFSTTMSTCTAAVQCVSQESMTAFHDVSQLIICSCQMLSLTDSENLIQIERNSQLLVRLRCGQHFAPCLVRLGQVIAIAVFLSRPAKGGKFGRHVDTNAEYIVGLITCV